MISGNDLAQQLADRLSVHGTSELIYSVSLFSSNRGEKAGVKGAINGRQYKVLMFEGSEESGLPSVSAHFTSDMRDDRLSDGQIAYWNADNRFTKLYRQGENVLLVMDTFLSEADDGLMRSVARIWDRAVREIPKFKIQYERMKGFS